MSSPKVIEYKLIKEHNETCLNSSVNNYLKIGWKLYESPIIIIADKFGSIKVYAQAMVKYEERIFPPLPTPPPLPTGPAPHTRPLPLPPFPLLPTAENAVAKAFTYSNLFKPEEIKQMQDACNELIKVLEGKSTDYQYCGKKSIYVCDMPQRLKNHLIDIGYGFSPSETHRNESYCYMYLA